MCIRDSDSSEYEIEEPIQQSDLGLVNGLLQSSNTTEEPSGPATTSFSQFELLPRVIDGAPTIASTAKTVVVPARLAWTDDASQDSLIEVTRTTTSNPTGTKNNNALKAKEANDSFWSKIRSITDDVNDAPAPPAASTSTAATSVPESKKPARETLKAIVKKGADVRPKEATTTTSSTARDTSPVLFGRSNPTPTKTTTPVVDVGDGDHVLGSPSSSLSALANSVITPSTTPPSPAKATTSVAPPKTPVAARVGRALICDLCGCAELKGSEGMIIAPIEEGSTANPTSTAPTPQPYNSKVVPGFYVVHLLCALWSPEVYFEESSQDKAPTSSSSSTGDGDEGHYCGIGACIKRARHIKCAYCRQPGASLGCIKATCQRSYHRQCAEDAGAVLDCEDFQLACPHHKMMLPTTPTSTTTTTNK
eukprot:TRINITY_DN16765_c0_g1_i1.p1 TRINITY_DN16765_c0_g1~~TRINITY_DN16765_c0_g1_i1.p1  ORF type:complete len:421 (-),score=66.25 TRINITY_DN16765_c0_g1_i1:216-1478(-)